MAEIIIKKKNVETLEDVQKTMEYVEKVLAPGAEINESITFVVSREYEKTLIRDFLNVMIRAIELGATNPNIHDVIVAILEGWDSAPNVDSLALAIMRSDNPVLRGEYKNFVLVSIPVETEISEKEYEHLSKENYSDPEKFKEDIKKFVLEKVAPAVLKKYMEF